MKKNQCRISFLFLITSILFNSCKEIENPIPEGPLSPLGQVRVELIGDERNDDELFNLIVSDDKGEVYKAISNLQQTPDYIELNDGIYQIYLKSKNTEIRNSGDIVFQGLSETFEIHRSDTLDIQISLTYDEPKGQVRLQLAGYGIKDEPFAISVLNEDSIVIESLTDLVEIPDFIELEDGAYQIAVQSELRQATAIGEVVFSGISNRLEISHSDTLDIEVNITREVQELQGWYAVPDVPLSPRFAPSSFIIGDNIYIGFGANLNNERLQDWWVYSIINNSWKQLPDFPGGKRFATVSFSIGDKGYVCLGYDENTSNLLEFWEFDSKSETWKRLDDFPGSQRTSAAVFVIGSKAYLGSGLANGSTSLTDFYVYDQETNQWSEVPAFSGEATYGFTSFVIDGNAHLMAGVINNDQRTQRHIVFDPENEKWTEISPFPGAERLEGLGFSINGKGYFGLGNITNNYAGADLWVFNPESQSWQEAEAFTGEPRFSSIHGSNSSVGYFGFGQKGMDQFSDLYIFYPAK